MSFRSAKMYSRQLSSSYRINENKTKIIKNHLLRYYKQTIFSPVECHLQFCPIFFGFNSLKTISQLISFLGFFFQKLISNIGFICCLKSFNFRFCFENNTTKFSHNCWNLTDITTIFSVEKVEENRKTKE